MELGLQLAPSSQQTAGSRQETGDSRQEAMSQCPHVCAPLPLLPHDWTAARCYPPEPVPLPAPGPPNHILRHPGSPNYGLHIASGVEQSNVCPSVTLLRILSLVLI